jgi:predicted ATP-grasp superfamily ATP-dependent carboligase
MEDTLEAIARRTDNASYIVEPRYPIFVSPNIEIDVPLDGAPPRLTATDQIMDDDLAYKGSLYPSRARRLPEILAAAEEITRWMRTRGFVGRAGFDFVETGSVEEGPPWFFTEINPRINGSTYNIALLDGLARHAARNGFAPPRAFRVRAVPTGASNFAGVARLAGGCLYDPARGEGIVPHVVALNGQTKVGVIALASTVERANEVFDEAEERLAAPYSPAASRS